MDYDNSSRSSSVSSASTAFHGKGSKSEQLTFSGKETEDITTFLQEVQQIALAEGRQRDDDWRADYVGGCLKGPAFQWYIVQEDHIRFTWTSLCRALLQRFPVHSADKALMPARKGHIHLVSLDEDGELLGVLSRTIGTHGAMNFSKTGEPVLVSVPPLDVLEDSHCTMALLNPVPRIRNCSHLGLFWNSNPNSPDGVYGFLVAGKETSSGASAGHIRSRMERFTQIWSSIIDEDGTEELLISWVDGLGRLSRVHCDNDSERGLILRRRPVTTGSAKLVFVPYVDDHESDRS
ncbi:hypothetical protein FRB93_000878 [Tulasnella sp. JGI-2019a]|nr:hypothetical protein FRB93_000878 [Tulasnella sp. JGI-2019a]